MKITIYELLGLVKDGKAPKKIIYGYCEYEFVKGFNNYKNKDGLYLFEYLFANEYDALNKIVEIIEEKPKKIDEINFRNEKGETLIGANMWEFYYRLNELRNAVNYLLEKSDKDDRDKNVV